MDPSNPGLADGTVHAVDRFLDDWLVDDDVPGASVAIVDRDDLLYATGLGARDTDARDAATAETVYGVGSIAKPVTALTVLQLVDRGDLALDDRERVPPGSRGRTRRPRDGGETARALVGATA
jgi:CubicO group peptidase (beta-lactamase class C family)